MLHVCSDFCVRKCFREIAGKIQRIYANIHKWLTDK